jgi:signal transduction histidine kinase
MAGCLAGATHPLLPAATIGKMDLGRLLKGSMAPMLGVLALVQLTAGLSFSSHQRFGVPGQHATLTMHLLGTPISPSVQDLVVLAVLCLLSIAPVGLPTWPADMSAVSAVSAVGGLAVSCVACVVSLTLFQYVTVASVCALLLILYRVGRSVALPFTVPFLVLALIESPHGELGRVMVIVLVALGPAAAVAGIARRHSALAVGALRSDMADSAFEHMARGERARIARELHDVVAHHISMISVQAETARVTTAGMPPEAARRLTEISDTARAGLTEMRRLLGVLREDASDGAPIVARQPQPGLAQLGDLLDEARDASGTRVRFILSGSVRALDPGVELAAYRIVQEALTNARRHAPGAAIDVELRYCDGDLLVRIRDNGPGAASNTGGHGLIGMRERAQAVGGSLRAETAPGGGFLVEATLPAGSAEGTDQ